MNNIGSSLIILILAIVLLWFAVTDKLPRLLRAWDALKEDDGGGNQRVSAPTPITPRVPQLVLPSIPALGTSSQVPA